MFKPSWARCKDEWSMINTVEVRARAAGVRALKKNKHLVRLKVRHLFNKHTNKHIAHIAGIVVIGGQKFSANYV